MEFNPCPHQITQVLLKAGRKIRELEGRPEEKNDTIIFNETMALLHIPPVWVGKLTSRVANHLPSPAEMKDNEGKFVLPRKDCPMCGKKDSSVLLPICPSCKDSEGGQFKSGWKCNHERCGFVDDKSEKPWRQRMKEEYPEIYIPDGRKQDLGILTITDKGLE